MLNSKEYIINLIKDLKGRDIQVIAYDNSLWDSHIICTATSSVHAQAIHNHLSFSCKQAFGRVRKDLSDSWLLLDAGDNLVSVMLAEARQYYFQQED